MLPEPTALLQEWAGTEGPPLARTDTEWYCPGLSFALGGWGTAWRRGRR